MTKVYLVNVDNNEGDDPDNLGIFSSFDLAEEFIYREYNKSKDWRWEGRIWYVYTVTLDEPETRWEEASVNVYDQPPRT